MKRIEKYLELVFDKLTKKDWDNLIVITGDEGISKSNLLLHMTDWWYVKLKGKCVEEDIKHICINREQFLLDLKDCKKYEMTGYDEADLISRRTMDTFNVTLMKTYQVIRGDNLFTILIIPSVFDLDTFFRNRRVRGMFYVFKRGRCAFWSKNRLRKMLALNEKSAIKNMWRVRPTFFDTFPKYKGVLAELYKKKKDENMKGIRQKMYDDLQTKDDFAKNDREKRIHRCLEKGWSTATIAEFEGISQRRIQQIMKTLNESVKA